MSAAERPRYFLRAVYFPKLGDPYGPSDAHLGVAVGDLLDELDPDEERWPSRVHYHILVDELYEVIDARIADWKIETRERYARE